MDSLCGGVFVVDVSAAQPFSGITFILDQVHGWQHDCMGPMMGYGAYVCAGMWRMRGASATCHP